MNLDPDLPLIGGQPQDGFDRPIQVSVRSVLPARVAGNGLGRPAASWDLDLHLTSQDHTRLLLGDLVAIMDIDARFNMGYRRDWLTIGVIVHGSSPLPGHGPGMTVILTGPASAIRPKQDTAGHTGLTAPMLNLQLPGS